MAEADSLARDRLPDAPLTGRALLIEGGVVRDILPANAPVPAGTQVLDLNGKFILPGLIDSHVHWEDWMGELYVSHGVTSVVALTNVAKGMRTRSQMASDLPRLFHSGNRPLFTETSTDEDVRQAVRDWLKNEPDMANFPTHNDALAHAYAIAAAETHKAGFTIFGHAENAPAAERDGLDVFCDALNNEAKLNERDPVLIASSGGPGASFAWIVSKREFTGNWEYKLDYALYTSPPTSNWSGAALIDRDGKLVGIGSLIVREAPAEDPKLPGNVFVPIDLLKPILNDLVREGHRAGPARPWLGVSADEMQGHLLVTRVSPDGPADRAGLSVGDIILGVGGESVTTQAQFYERIWNRRRAGDEVPLKVLQGADVKEIKVRSIDRVEYFRPRSTI